MFRSHILKSLCIVLAVALFCNLVRVGQTAQAAPQATFIVNSGNDDPDQTPGDGQCKTSLNTCTLRAAVMEANVLAGADTITVPSSVAVVGLRTPLTISSQITIIGAGWSSNTIRGVELPYPLGFNILVSGNLSLNGFTVQYLSPAISNTGQATINSCFFIDNVNAAQGGAIANLHILSITDSFFEDNLSYVGGGAISHSGDTDDALGITNSEFRYNDSLHGGALYLVGTSPVLINFSDFFGNVALNGEPVARGGAIYINATGAGTGYEIRNTDLWNNTADEGGALFVDYGDVKLVGSSIFTNTVTGSGAGIYFDGSTLDTHPLTILNSTLSNNQADQHGGGLYVNNGYVNIASSTIAGNGADANDDNVGDGGGISRSSNIFLQIQLKNTILAENDDHSSGLFDFFAPECYGSLTSGGYNLIGRLAGLCSLNGDLSGNQTGTLASPLDPGLEPLDDGVYYSNFHALKSGSPAVEKGNPLGCSDFNGGYLLEDQRGEPRPQGMRCDIGSYETPYFYYWTMIPLLMRN